MDNSFLTARKSGADSMVKFAVIVRIDANKSGLKCGESLNLNSGFYSIDPNIVHQRVGEEIILINLNTDRIFTLNNTSSKLWEYINEGLALDQIRSKLLTEFDVDATQLDLELDQMIVELTNEKFLSPK